MSINNIPSCARYAGIYRMRTNQNPTGKHVFIPFRCGRSDCPICSHIKRRRLIRRLKSARWPDKVVMWTITTDPSILSSDEALKSLSVRWHRVCRTLLRQYPDLKYFRVLEFTQSGLPHLHVLFDRYVDWHDFRRVLMHHCFGKVLHFTTIPKDSGFSYLTKYLTKSIHQSPYMRQLHLRSWSASLHFIPMVKYFQDGTEFDILWIGRVNSLAERMMEHLGADILKTNAARARSKCGPDG
jgi:hypothetical protein